MSGVDDQQRRVMTPPEEWGNSNEAPDFILDNHSSKTPQMGDNQSPPDTNESIDGIIWRDHAESDDYISSLHDEDRGRIKHDDDDLVVLGNDQPEPTSNTHPPSEEAAYGDVRNASSFWSLITICLAVVVIVVGSWGLLNERSHMTDRIAELEANLSLPTRRGDLSVNEEQELINEQTSLKSQLMNMQNKYDSLNQKLLAFEGSANIANSSNAEAVDKDNPVLSTINDNEKTVATSSRTEENPVDSAGLATTDETLLYRDRDRPTRSTEKQDPVVKGDWFINIATYASASLAQSWVDKLSALVDERVTRLTTTSNGKTLHRVRVVEIADKDSAQRLAKTIEETHNTGPLWIGNNRFEARGKTEVEKSIDTARNESKPSVDSVGASSTPIMTSTGVDSDMVTPVELRDLSNKSGWFIYIDTFSEGRDAEAKVRDIQSAGYDAKIAMEYRSGELFYRVQVVGINSREEGEIVARSLSTLEDMPNLQLRQY